MAEVTRVEGSGIFLKLLEYNNLEGLMMRNELSKRRYRTNSKLVKVNRRVVVMVLRVDTEGNNVDLSKKRVAPAERIKFYESFKNNAKFHNIMKQVCARCDYSLEGLYESFAWKLYEDFPQGINGLELLNNDPEKFFSKYTVPEEVKPSLVENVKKRLAKKVRKIQAIIEVNCYNPSGVNSIRKAIIAGENAVEDKSVKIKLMKSPKFFVTTQTKDLEAGTNNVMKACEAIEKEILRLKGLYSIIESAKVEEEEAPENSEDEYLM